MQIPTKEKFPQTREFTYLNTAAEGLLSTDSPDALAAYVRDKSRGSLGRPSLYAMEKDTLGLAATLLETSPDSVAFLANATEGVNLLVNSLDWQEGDEVVITDLEFPSNVLPWLRLKERGVRVRVVRADAGRLGLEDFTASMSPQTRVVSVSLVSYKSGTRIPFVRDLAEETHRVGAILCLDATQALGRVPVTLDGVDYMVASSYKWLFTPHGLGITYCSPELLERIKPATAGWYGVPNIFTADRFERFEYKPGAARFASGMPNFPTIYALNASLRYLLELGVDRIDEALRPLVTSLRAGFADLGLDLLTPAEREFQAGIVSFAHPEAQRIGLELAEANIVVWANDGRVRTAVHLYNEQDEIDRHLLAIEHILHVPTPRCQRRGPGAALG